MEKLHLVLQNVRSRLVSKIKSDKAGAKESLLKQANWSEIKMHQRNGLCSLIKNFPFLSDVQEDKLKLLLENAQVKKYKKGSVLLLEGDYPSAFYLILNGWVKLSKISFNGEESVIQLFSSGNTLIESSMILNTPSQVNIQTMAYSTLISIPVAAIKRLAENCQFFALNILNLLSKQLETLTSHIGNIRLKAAEERVGWFLLNLFSNNYAPSNVLQLPYNKGIIASYLGMKAETFSRALNDLKKKGFQIKNNAVIMPNTKALCNFCDVSIYPRCPRYNKNECPLLQ